MRSPLKRNKVPTATSVMAKPVCFIITLRSATRQWRLTDLTAASKYQCPADACRASCWALVYANERTLGKRLVSTRSECETPREKKCDGRNREDSRHLSAIRLRGRRESAARRRRPPRPGSATLSDSERRTRERERERRPSRAAFNALLRHKTRPDWPRPPLSASAPPFVDVNFRLVVVVVVFFSPSVSLFRRP